MRQPLLDPALTPLVAALARLAERRTHALAAPKERKD
jgi:hypothetical protein